MSKRSKDAYYIWWIGASNPAGVARSLVEAIDECRTDGSSPDDDMHCQMILDQLAVLLGLPQPSFDPDVDTKSWADFCTTFEETLNR